MRFHDEPGLRRIRHPDETDHGDTRVRQLVKPHVTHDRHVKPDENLHVERLETGVTIPTSVAAMSPVTRA